MEDATLKEIPWKDILTIALASVGAVLGVINTWNAINQHRVRLRVNPALAFAPDGAPLALSIEIVNLSAFPITLTELGFKLSRAKKIPMLDAASLDGKSLPRRLEAREAAVFLLNVQALSQARGLHLTKAYVRTACGRVKTGSSPAFRDIRDILEKS